MTLVEPPLRLAQLRYDPDGVLRYPEHADRAPVAVLAEHLAEARALFASLPEPADDPSLADLGVDFEQLRWFDLPAESVAP